MTACVATAAEDIQRLLLTAAGMYFGCLHCSAHPTPGLHVPLYLPVLPQKQCCECCACLFLR
jgi:hypothetical protein